MPSVFPQADDETPTTPFVDGSGALTWRAGHEVVRIEAWGPDACGCGPLWASSSTTMAP